MAYNITKTDSTVIGTISDGTVNSSSTSLVLIGKNYAGYGNFLNSNLVKLLENFAYGTAPSAPQTGQLWYDTANSLLKISTDGSSNLWKPLASLTKSTTTPTSPAPIEGDLWWDQASLQLKVYGGSTNGWITVGPAFSTVGGTTGSVVDTILDSNSNSQVVIKLLVGGSVIGIVSGNTTPFTPQTTISGFSSIKYGINVHSSAKFEGGLANNTSLLSGLTSSQFLRSDQDASTNYKITTGTGITGGFGVGNVLSIAATTSNVIITSSKNDNDIEFWANSAGTVSKTFSISGSNRQANFSNALVVGGAVTANTTVSVAGDGTFSSNLTVSGFLRPGSNGGSSIGAPNRYFGNVYANVVTAGNATISNVTVTNLNGLANISATTHHGTHANVTNVNASTVNASSFLKTAVYANTTVRDSSITSPTAGMIVFVTSGTTFFGYTGSGWVALN